MGQVFEMYLMEEVVMREGDVDSVRYFLEPHPESEEPLDEFLTVFEFDSFSLFLRLNSSLAQEDLWPWAVVLLPSEYPIAEHVMTLRAQREDVLFTSYSMRGRDDGQQLLLFETAPPPVSILLIKEKSTFEQLAGVSPIFGQLWAVLRDRDELGYWLYLANPIDSKLVRSCRDREQSSTAGKSTPVGLLSVPRLSN